MCWCKISVEGCVEHKCSRMELCERDIAACCKVITQVVQTKFLRVLMRDDPTVLIDKPMCVRCSRYGANAWLVLLLGLLVQTEGIIELYHLLCVGWHPAVASIKQGKLLCQLCIQLSA